MARRDGCDEFYDRAVGSLLGLAVGAPVEFRRRDTFEPVTDMRAGGHFNLPAGAWTDDTAMAFAVEKVWLTTLIWIRKISWIDFASGLRRGLNCFIRSI